MVVTFGQVVSYLKRFRSFNIDIRIELDFKEWIRARKGSHIQEVYKYRRFEPRKLRAHICHPRIGRLPSLPPPLFLGSLSMLAFFLSVQNCLLTLSVLRRVKNGKKQ